MKTYLLASFAILFACCYVGSAFGADSGAEVETLVFPDSYTGGSVSNGGTISGIVKFEGDVPKMKMLEITKDQAVCAATEKYDESLVVGDGNALKNTIVYLIDISKGKAFDKAAKPEIDQEGCRFEPHVQILPINTRLTMLNSDRVNHNVHIFNVVNKPINKQHTKNRKKMPIAAVKKAEGPVSVKCDIHGWMSAWIAHVPHPYFAVTNEKGEFMLEDVPAGTYKLGYWHETCGTNSAAPASVTVEAGGSVTQDFTLKLK